MRTYQQISLLSTAIKYLVCLNRQYPGAYIS